MNEEEAKGRAAAGTGPQPHLWSYSSVDLTISGPLHAGPWFRLGKLSLCNSLEISRKVLPLVSGRKKPV